MSCHGYHKKWCNPTSSNSTDHKILAPCKIQNYIQKLHWDAKQWILIIIIYIEYAWTIIHCDMYYMHTMQYTYPRLPKEWREFIFVSRQLHKGLNKSMTMHKMSFFMQHACLSCPEAQRGDRGERDHVSNRIMHVSILLCMQCM